MDETHSHIFNVRNKMQQVIENLKNRGVIHDASKLQNPEKEIFEKYTKCLKETTYGSPKYDSYLKEMHVALEHHYACNSHHPQFFKNGIDGMSLLDIMEMFCDWKAATERHADGNLSKSIKHNEKRFAISEQLIKIFQNTQKELEW